MDLEQVRRLVFRVQDEGAEKVIADFEKLAVAQQKVGTAAVAAGAQSEQLTRAQLSLRNSAERLMTANDQAYRAQKQLEQGQRTLNAALAQGVIDSNFHTNAMTALQTSYIRLAGHQRNFGNQTKLNQLQIQNLGYQFNDLAVMTASGQNPFMMLMQQGMQIGQIIGPMGLQAGLKALGTGLVSFLINPVNLAVLGFASLVGGAVYFFSKWNEGAPKIEDALKRQRDLMKEIADLQGRPMTGAQQFGLRSSRAELNLISRMEIAEVAAGLPGTVSNAGGRANRSELISFGPFAAAAKQLFNEIRAGRPDITRFREEVMRIANSSLDAKIDLSAKELLKLTQNAEGAAQALREVAWADAIRDRFPTRTARQREDNSMREYERGLDPFRMGGNMADWDRQWGRTSQWTQQTADLLQYNATLDRTNSLMKAQSDFFGQQFLSGVMSLRQGFDGLSAAVDRFAESLMEAVLQAAILGTGPLAGFGGLSSQGGLFGRLFGRFFPQGGARIGGGGGTDAYFRPSGGGSDLLNGGSGTNAGSSAAGMVGAGLSGAFSGGRMAASPVSGSSVQAQMWNYWAAQGLPPNSIAAIMGNAGIESAGFKPHVLGDRGASFGLFQWQGSRRAELHGLYGNMPTVAQQQNFAQAEMQRDYPGLWSKLQAGGSVQDLTAQFARQFERPADLSQSIDRRIEIANESLAKFGNSMRTISAGTEQIGTGFVSSFGNQMGKIVQGIGGQTGGGGGLFSWIGSLFGGLGGGSSAAPGGPVGLGEHTNFGAPASNAGAAMGPPVINNYTGQEATARLAADGRGRRRWEVSIGEVVSQGMGSKQGQKTMRGQYGVEQNLVQT